MALSLHVVNRDIISKTAVEKSFVVQYTFWLKIFNAEATTVGFTWYGVPICLWRTKSSTLCLIFFKGYRAFVFQEEPPQTGSGWINMCNLTGQQPRPTSQAWWGPAGVGGLGALVNIYLKGPLDWGELQNMNGSLPSIECRLVTCAKR